MVDPIKSCTEVNLHDPSLLPILQCTLQCMGHTQECITGTQTFPISKLGGWKDTTAFHKSSKTNRHQALKHLEALTTFRERRRQDRMEGKLRYHYQYHHNYLLPQLPTTTTTPPTLTDQEVGVVKYGGKTSENAVTFSFKLIQIPTSNLRMHYQPHAWL